jgi:hypothetical protein
VKIHDSTFQGNSAGYVSVSETILRHFFIFSLKFLAGHMEQSSAGHCSFDSTRIAAKLGTVQPGECQFPFALLFRSIRSLSEKELSENFAPIPGGPHATTF